MWGRELADGQQRPVAIDLFCGAGGLSHGLLEAGFDVALGLDFDRHALRTFEANHRGAAVLQADVREVSGTDLLRAAGVSHIDLLAGGPSCRASAPTESASSMIRETSCIKSSCG